MTEVVQTRRLRLEPVTNADTDGLCALMSLPCVRRYLCDDCPVPRHVVEGWIGDSLDASSLTSYWRIATGAVRCIGLIGLRPSSPEILRLRAIGWRSLELVIALDPKFQGTGLATEAVEAIAELAGRHGITFALVAAVDVPNRRSHALMRRCGFHELGRASGAAHPLVIYERAV